MKKNWERLDEKKLKAIMDRDKPPENVRKNLMFLLKETKKNKWAGLFFITAVCRCGRHEKRMVALADFKDQSKEVRDSYEKDEPIGAMCENCTEKALGYARMGMTTETIEEMLGWNEPKDVVAG